MYLWEIKACLKLHRRSVAYCKVEKGNLTMITIFFEGFFYNDILVIVESSQFSP